MPQSGLIVRALIASPSDCVQERRIVPEVISAWNAVHSLERAAVVEPVLWETHSRPSLGDRPQAIINRQIVNQCDILIGTFWTRLGTPTGEAESGTAEEIERFRNAGKPVLLYFSSAPVVPESLDHAQYEALVAYRNELGTSGLYSTYESTAEFREQLQRHLAGTLIELLGTHAREGGTSHVVSALEEQRAVVRQFQRDFESFLRRLSADWTAERDSDPINTQEGKYVLARAVDEVAHFQSMITDDRVGLTTILSEASRRLRAVQRHQTFIDGGRSFREFWDEGNQIIDLLRSVPPRIEQVLEGGADRVQPDA